MKKKFLYKLILFITTIGMGIFFVLLFNHYYLEINRSLIEIEGARLLFIVSLLRILFSALIAIYLFNLWFKQEKQFLSDIPFLFAMFFYMLAIGKTFDLFWNFTFFYLSEDLLLFWLKIRLIIAILTLAPFIYLGLVIFFITYSYKHSEISEITIKKIRFLLILTISTIELLIIILAPNQDILSVILAMMVLPSFTVIVYTFFLAYKIKRLSQIHCLIIGTGFLLYMISTIVRTLLAIQYKNAYALFIIEIIDTIILLIIFIGFLRKPNYGNA